MLWATVLTLALAGLLRGADLVQQQPAAAADASLNPRADASLIPRMVASQQATMKRLLEVCFRQSILEEKLHGDDRIKEQEELVCHLDGVPLQLYRRLVINGHPTGESETDPWPDICKDDDWQKKVERAAKRRQRVQELIGEVRKAMDFTRLVA